MAWCSGSGAVVFTFDLFDGTKIKQIHLMARGEVEAC